MSNKMPQNTDNQSDAHRFITPRHRTGVQKWKNQTYRWNWIQCDIDGKTWKSSSAEREWNASSSSLSAYIRVSGTYLPPNLPNRPNESGRYNTTDPLSLSARIDSGSLMSEHGTEGEVRVTDEGKGGNFRKFEGQCEEGKISFGRIIVESRGLLQVAELVTE